MRRLIFIEDAERFEDLALLLLRLGTGAFLIHGVWDNIVDPARMTEFAGFLRQFGFPAPGFMALLSVSAQFLCGLLLIVGLVTRWAGLVLAFNFVVAIVMVDRLSGIRASWPAGALILIGILLAAHGAGRFSLERLILGRARRA